MKCSVVSAVLRGSEPQSAPSAACRRGAALPDDAEPQPVPSPSQQPKPVTFRHTPRRPTCKSEWESGPRLLLCSFFVPLLLSPHRFTLYSLFVMVCVSLFRLSVLNLPYKRSYEGGRTANGTDKPVQKNGGSESNIRHSLALKR